MWRDGDKTASVVSNRSSQPFGLCLVSQSSQSHVACYSPLLSASSPSRLSLPSLVTAHRSLPRLSVVSVSRRLLQPVALCLVSQSSQSHVACYSPSLSASSLNRLSLTSLVTAHRSLPRLSVDSVSCCLLQPVALCLVSQSSQSHVASYSPSLSASSLSRLSLTSLVTARRSLPRLPVVSVSCC